MGCRHEAPGRLPPASFTPDVHPPHSRGPPSPSRRPTWSIVWLAPVSRSSAGRSPVTSSSGTPLCDASTTQGSRLATAVPLEVTTTAGRPVARPYPSAQKPRDRSSAAAAWQAGRRKQSRQGDHAQGGQVSACRQRKRRSRSPHRRCCIWPQLWPGRNYIPKQRLTNAGHDTGARVLRNGHGEGR